jgi:hypothetical protein
MDDDINVPIPEDVQEVLDRISRRNEQSLGYFPFPDAPERFFRVGPEQDYTKENASEVLRIVSSW